MLNVPQTKHVRSKLILFIGLHLFVLLRCRLKPLFSSDQPNALGVV